MKCLLEKICSDSLVEARWLNTLSLLEFIGSRKISRTVASHHPQPEILSHYSDEIRHARVFKELSIKLIGHDLGDDSLARQAGQEYFRALDKTVSDAITRIHGSPDQHANYIFVTLAIERRAMKLYPLYRSVTKNESVRAALTSILQEEDAHLDMMEKAAADFAKRHSAGTVADMIGIEADLFEKFWVRLAAALAQRGHVH